MARPARASGFSVRKTATGRSIACLALALLGCAEARNEPVEGMGLPDAAVTADGGAPADGAAASPTGVPSAAAADGGTSRPVDGGPPPPIDGQAPAPPSAGGPSPCAAIARAYCTKFKACDPEAFARRHPAGREDETCLLVQTSLCDNVVELADTGIDMAQLNACAQAVTDQTCNTWFAGDPDVCLVRPGQRPDGVTCADDAQCSSIRCDNKQGGCGVCRPRLRGPPPGMACRSGLCDYNVPCVNDVCAKRAGVGARCADSVECGDRLRCQGGRCGPPSGRNATCVSADSTCGFGLTCRAGVCVAADGITCANNADCKTDQVCKASISRCQPGGLDASCSTDDDCAVGVCNAGRCGRGNPNRCAYSMSHPPAGLCSTCGIDTDCQSPSVCASIVELEGLKLCVPPAEVTCEYTYDVPSLSFSWGYLATLSIPLEP